jgi:hypothetical protein
LNQIVLDAKSNSIDQELYNEIKAMIWLDGAHNGGKHTWITNKSDLEPFVKQTSCNVDVRVSPYQIKDDRRPWIGEEEEIFSTILKDILGPQRFQRKVYFADEKANFENHFKVIDTLLSD